VATTPSFSAPYFLALFFTYLQVQKLNSEAELLAELQSLNF
jgi:hypothetical protein